VNGRVTDVASLVQAAQQPQSGLAVPMPRDTYPYAFGPGMPLQPAPLDRSGGTPARGAAAVGIPVSWIFRSRGHRPAGAVAVVAGRGDRIAVIRDCIRIRKTK